MPTALVNCAFSLTWLATAVTRLSTLVIFETLVSTLALRVLMFVVFVLTWLDTLLILLVFALTWLVTFVILACILV